MIRVLLHGGALLGVLLLTSVQGLAATVTYSGNVSYDGAYSADSLHVIVLEIADEDDTLIQLDTVAFGSPPNTVGYSVTFENSGVADSVLIGAILNVDGSPWDPDVLTTNGDVVGWYDGQLDPLFVATSASQSGLDFALPTAEIRGSVTFAAGQTWAEIESCSVPNSWCPQVFELTASGNYALPGHYEGGWIVSGYGPFGEICYGDPTCLSPTEIFLVDDEIRSGIDLDFSTVANDPPSWGMIKARYR